MIDVSDPVRMVCLLLPCVRKEQEILVGASLCVQCVLKSRARSMVSFINLSSTCSQKKNI